MVLLSHHQVPSKAHTLLNDAIEDLGINNPVLHYEVTGNTITIWFLAMPEPVTWTQPQDRRGARPPSSGGRRDPLRPKKPTPKGTRITKKASA